MPYESLRSGSAGSRLAAPDDANVVLLFGGEQQGVLGPCGCEQRPLGSLARVEGYRKRVARRDPGVLLLNLGGWLDDSRDGDGVLRADVVLADRRMVEGLALGHWDVLNIGEPELPWLLLEGFPEGVVSANLAGAPSHVTRQVGEVRVAITGVAGGPSFGDPVEALGALVPLLDADLVVVLAYDTGRATRDLLRVPGVDVLLEAGGYEQHFEALTVDKALWVRSLAQTQALSELRLVVDGGTLRAGLERQIDLDDQIPADGELRRLERRTTAEIDAMQRALYLP